MKTVSSIQEYSSIPLDLRKFVYLNDKALNEISVSENNEKIIYFSDFKNEEGIKIFFAPNNTYSARETLVKKVYEAAKLLPEGVYFRLYSGFRPIEIQQKLFDEIYADYKIKMPNLDENSLLNEVTKMIADPKGCPPHTTGGAIDLTLCNVNGEELDMGCKVDDAENIHLAETFAESITEQQKNNRSILYNAMLTVGFVNLPSEWWHFIYGDRYWAAVTGMRNTLYGPQSVDMSPGIYTR